MVYEVNLQFLNVGRPAEYYTAQVKFPNSSFMVRSDIHCFASADACHLHGYLRCTYIIRNAQSCCEKPSSADIDQCTSMKSECTIYFENGVIICRQSAW